MTDQPTPRAPEHEHGLPQYPALEPDDGCPRCDCTLHLYDPEDCPSCSCVPAPEPSAPEPVYDVSPGAFMEVEPSAPDDLREQVTGAIQDPWDVPCPVQKCRAAAYTACIRPEPHIERKAAAVMDVLRREGVA